jgi:hypothetical protein
LSRPGEEGEALTSDRQIRDEAVTLFVAGFENIATALTWTWYLLAQHPEVEGRLHAAFDEVLGGRPPGAEDMPRLPYTRMVFEESVRVGRGRSGRGLRPRPRRCWPRRRRTRARAQQRERHVAHVQLGAAAPVELFTGDENPQALRKPSRSRRGGLT